MHRLPHCGHKGGCTPWWHMAVRLTVQKQFQHRNAKKCSQQSLEGNLIRGAATSWWELLMKCQTINLVDVDWYVHYAKRINGRLIEGFKYMSGVHPITYTHTPKAPSFSTQKLHIGCDLAAHRLGNISQVVVIAVKRSHLPGKKLINDDDHILKNLQFQQPTWRSSQIQQHHTPKNPIKVTCKNKNFCTVEALGLRSEAWSFLPVF